jgi:hypothetical protein
MASALVVAEQKPETLAEQSAQSWLALVDAGNYAQSWQEASSLFRAQVGKDNWQRRLHATRDPLGKVISRSLKGAEYTTTLPGVPDGQYVVLEFETSFENKRSAVETVTPMLDKDGTWRVSGYFIE